MAKLVKFFSIFVILAALIVGCQNGSTPVEPENDTFGMALFTLPEGAEFQSATFFVYVTVPSGQTVNVYRVTSGWDETTVTWNNFGEAYDPTVIGSFVADAEDWRSVDVTSLVNGWLNGAYGNFGLLLDQDIVSYPRAIYHSREASFNQPFLEISYTLNGDLVYQEALCDGDAYINEYLADENYGTESLLFTGFAADVDYEKQSLFLFEVEGNPPPDGCSLTIGFWKTHAGFGPQADVVTPLLPIWLGTADGDKSLYVDDAAMAVDVLKEKTYGDPDNGITKLYAQLLGVKLNLANGADDSEVSAAIAAADAFLADNDWNDWEGLSEEDQEMVLDWKDMFDDYNNGDIGPGHCDD